MQVSIEELLAKAIKRHQQGQLSEAEDIYRKVLSVNQSHPVALHHLGLIAHQLGNIEAGLQLIYKAIEVDGGYLVASVDLSNFLFELGRSQEAELLLADAIKRNPEDPDVHFQLGMLKKEMGQADAAESSYGKAINLSENPDPIRANLAVLLDELGRSDEAIEIYLDLLSRSPDDVQILNNLGNTLENCGRYSEAINAYESAMRLDGHDPILLYNAGIAYGKIGSISRALECLESAVAINPDLSNFRLTLGSQYRRQGRITKAIQHFQVACDLENDNPRIHVQLGHALFSGGDVQGALDHFMFARNLAPEDSEIHSVYVYAHQYVPDVDASLLYDVHREWARRHTPAPDNAKIGIPLTEDQPIRIGFLSSNLGRHPTGYFLYNCFKHCDRSKVQLVGYSDRTPDDLTNEFEAMADEWRDIRFVRDAELCQLISSDGISILFDLSGHMPKGRLPLLAHRLAPVQVNWAGYVGTTGLTQMDFIFADEYHIPRGEEGYYTETVVRLADAFVSYFPPEYLSEVSELPALGNGFITFGSFGSPRKLRNVIIHQWARILQQLPSSRLVLLYTTMDDPMNIGRILKIMNEYNIAGERLFFIGQTSHVGTLNKYRDIDIALDTYPYSGGLTTCEALCMGIPVITTPGPFFAGRTSQSFLNAAGLKQFIADDLNRYVDLAVSTAADLSKLSNLRSTLREQVLCSPLCDGPRFARSFEDAVNEIRMKNTHP